MSQRKNIRMPGGEATQMSYNQNVMPSRFAFITRLFRADFPRRNYMGS